MQEPETYHPLVRFAVERRVTMGMIILGVLVLGALSLERLPLEYLPAFSSSNITVSAPYPSSSPEEVERLVVRPLEDSLATINGIETLSSSAEADRAQIRVSFFDGVDMDLAAVEVRDRIDRARHLLPDDLDRINIRRFQSSDIPVLRFDLSAEWPVERLYDFAENVVQRRLERLEGVAQVNVGGLRVPELQVNLDLGRLRAYGVDTRQVAQALQSNNLDLSAGDLRTERRSLLVRVVGHLSSPAEVRDLPLGRNGLRLGDVAEVAYTFPEKEDFNFLNGVEALTVSVNKTSSANVLAVADRVKAEMEAIAATAGEGFDWRIFQDASLDVRQGLGQLRDAGLLGGFLAILAMYLFLHRFRTTALVAVAIPISIVTTFVLIYFLRQAGVLDLTLNVVSLAGLMLALGMLVDNSVVVIESIFRHRNELGEDSRTAALAGASEVALPIVASTATTLCVFLPVIFLSGGGRFSLYLEDIGVTVCIVMVASLLVALTVVPLVAVTLLRRQESRPSSRFIDSLNRAYGWLLARTLHHRFAFVVVILALLGGVVYLFSTIERAFTGRSLERQVIVKVDTPRQYSLEQTESLYREVYELLDAHREELDIADIAYAYDRETGRSRSSWRRTRQFDIFLEDESESELSTAEARERIRALLPTKAGVGLRIQMSEGRHGGGGIELELSGDDPAVLELVAGRVAAELAAMPSLRDVDTSLESGDQEIQVRVQPARALQAGLSSSAVAFTVNSALSGRAASRFQTGEREVDMVVRYREEDRATLDHLKQVPVFADEAPLPLDALADFELAAGPRSIEREDHLAQVSVSANTTDPRASFLVMRRVSDLMRSTALPPGYDWSFGRWTRYMQQDQQSGLFALLFALPLVYMLMAALFESFAQPFTIMFSIPFALLGVGVVMKLASQPWETMTMIGLLVLLGVVVNNAIVLVDHVNRLRWQGLSRDRAIILGGQHRLRPILITAVTTIVGLLPMVAPFLLPEVFGTVEGRAASWAPIGLVIIGGLTTSTFLTLMIIPTIYSLIDDFLRFVRRVAREVQA